MISTTTAASRKTTVTNKGGHDSHENFTNHNPPSSSTIKKGTQKKKTKKKKKNSNLHNWLFVALVLFILLWVGVYIYAVPGLLYTAETMNSRNANTHRQQSSPYLNQLQHQNEQLHQYQEQKHEQKKKEKSRVLGVLDSHHHLKLNHNHDEEIDLSQLHKDQQLSPKEEEVEVTEKVGNHKKKHKKKHKIATRNNPYEGWQPTIHKDSEDGDKGDKCHTWRTCFPDSHECPGKCRDGLEDFGTAPPRPTAEWIPDVTVLRRMMLAGQDADGNPWPPPLLMDDTSATTTKEDHGRELCDPIGVFGGTNDENIVSINAIPIRGRPLVPPIQMTEKKQPRILCMVYTMAQNHHTSIRAIRETWAGGCDGFLAFSTQDDPRIPAISLPHEGPEEYNNMWQKVRSIWRFVGTHYLDDFDFFFQGGEDLYVLPQNLRNYLASAIEDPTTEDFFGGRRFQIPHGPAFNSGGAGYALSQATLRKLHDVGLDHPKCTPHAHTATEDVQIARCLKEVFDIGIVDTRDEQERERFHPFSPGAHYTWTPPRKGHTDWYESYNRLWPNKLREQCCAPDSVSFHYMKKPAMVRHIHSLLYFCDSTETVQ